MKIKFLTISAGPEGNYQPGDVADIENGYDLVEAGFAVSIETVEKIEVKQEKEPEKEVKTVTKNKKSGSK